jgi:surface antigen
MSTVKQASANTYPIGQCTWYACEKYHTLTGYYIPWKGNANQWPTMALQNAWYASSIPTVGSICALQAGVQGADNTYGHVSIVETIKGNTVYCSMQNWNGITYPNTTYWTFIVGSGVSFITASSSLATSAGLGTNGTNVTSLSTAITAVQTLITTSSEQSHAILNTIPGFLGVCEALDTVEQFVPFTLPTQGQSDLATATQNNNVTVFGWNTGLINPFGIAQSINAANALPSDSIQAVLVFTVTNFMSFATRAFFVIIGILFFY